MIYLLFVLRIYVGGAEGIGAYLALPHKCHSPQAVYVITPDGPLLSLRVSGCIPASYERGMHNFSSLQICHKCANLHADLIVNLQVCD